MSIVFFFQFRLLLNERVNQISSLQLPVMAAYILKCFKINAYIFNICYQFFYLAANNTKVIILYPHTIISFLK